MGDEEFAPDVIRDLEPVELFKDGGYMVTQAGVGEKGGRWNVEGIHEGE